MVHYSGRPTPIYFARRWSRILGGARIFLKREDLGSTGSHKINNVIGQILLAKRMGKTRVVAETGAGQHGVAVSTFAAKFNLQCTIFMGQADAERQVPNVRRMRLLGAQVVVVTSGSCGLKEALSEAIREWVSDDKRAFYVLGTAAGPHPYPHIVRDFQRLIGEESLTQLLTIINRQPSMIVACVGGGSNAIGMFLPSTDSISKMVGVEAAGEGQEVRRSAASLSSGLPGILHGTYTYILQSWEGQINRTHSVSAGLDYPGIGPEHSFLKDTKRVEYVQVKDCEAVEAFLQCIRIEGIVPALESSHALSYGTKMSAYFGTDEAILINLSGSGEKDMQNFVRDIS
ncbi:tryptophan synthase subunit beta [Candidatus Tremblaya phenacola PAVE]|nr:tryptophan synthase subunit beta [Candidatus Tremblaya phenacola PAVE]